MGAGSKQRFLPWNNLRPTLDAISGFRAAVGRLGLMVAVAWLAMTVAGGSAGTQPGPAFETPDPALFIAWDDDTTIYLFGTVHLVPCAPGLDPPVCATGITPSIRDAIAASDEVWLETDLLEGGDSSFFYDQAFFDDGRVLSDYIPADDLRIIAEAVASAISALDPDLDSTTDMTLAAIDLMKPWLVSSIISEIGIVETWGPGVDFEVADIANELGIPLFGFAIGEEHDAIIASGPLEYQVAELRSYAVMLRSGIDLAAISEWSISTVWDLWSAGRLDRLEALEMELLGNTYDAEIAALLGMTEAELKAINNEIEVVFPHKMQMAQLDEEDARLLTQRNFDWMSDIEEMLDRPGTFFIAVGAMHLVRDYGLPALLRHFDAIVQRVQ